MKKVIALRCFVKSWSKAYTHAPIKYLHVYEERVYDLFTGHNTLCTEVNH